ncbi:uncharacterized protein DFL_000307 [Arthrobotrys flagrans]|uniref:Uncharacterized protein n=1 Tax=Arthrobotrys flagrans TaxID=97331 RepID=A0A437ADH6_ARTFL|nr:hypothetical protein DFL_000307 [Arthrobotrys flagrans]
MDSHNRLLLRTTGLPENISMQLYGDVGEQSSRLANLLKQYTGIEYDFVVNLGQLYTTSKTDERLQSQSENIGQISLEDIERELRRAREEVRMLGTSSMAYENFKEQWLPNKFGMEDDISHGFAGMLIC